MATKYQFMYNGNLVDFSDVFEPFGPGDSAITTGFKSNTTDLGTLFKGITGNSIVTTNYKNSSGTDLGSLFQKKAPFTVTNSSSGIKYTIGPGPEYATYAYAIFTDIFWTGEVKFNDTSYSEIYYIIVGGGGGGGVSAVGISNGGGGGGGVYLYKGDTTTTHIRVGKGGASGQDGIESAIVTSTGENICKCTGGARGTNNAGGAGGKVFIGTSVTPLIGITGGNGGDQLNGSPCTYNSDINSGEKLEVPINPDPSYISNYYSGGGGGAKRDSSFPSYSGGQGGGTISATNPNSGLGGARGISDGTSSNGFDGNGYGSGGGAGGWSSFSSPKIGGNGRQGIIIVYVKL
jgi:hypothetical protein